MEPDERRAQLWQLPPFSSTAPLTRGTAVGTLRASSTGWPISPHELLPQQVTVASARTAHEKP